MAECIFCKIAAGDLPSAKVYEDDQLLAFLDIAPVAPGHVLVVPRQHYPLVTDLPAEQMAAVGSVLPKLSRAVMEGVDADGLTIFQSNGACAGQEIMHVHFHIVPRHERDGLGIRPKPGRYAEGEIEEYRNLIAAKL